MIAVASLGWDGIIGPIRSIVLSESLDKKEEVFRSTDN